VWTIPGSSNAFDKVLHSGLLKKLLNKNMPLSLVGLLNNWYSRLCCSVKYNRVIRERFKALCGFCQGGVLSPYLFALYVDDLADNLRFSGYGLHVGSLFVGCIFYADDIVLLSPTCFGLQQLLNICEQFASNWYIKFNTDKSQLITFGGRNTYSSKLSLYEWLTVNVG